MKLNNLKFKVFIYTLIVTVSVYLVFGYGMPLILPFLIGYLIAHIINPMLFWLEQRIRINRTVGIILLLAAICGIFLIGASLLVREIFNQLTALLNNSDSIIDMVYSKMDSVVDWISKSFGIGHEELTHLVNDNLDKLGTVSKDAIMQFLMDKSVPILTGIIEFFVAVFIIIFAAYLFAKNRDSTVEWRKHFIFKKELNLIVGKLRIVLNAYVKTQALIMLITAVVCVIGLWLLGNEYSIILGIAIGFLDALPFIGTGLILIPWAIVSLFGGKIVEGIALIVIFIITDIIREILEPKLMGNNIGISPIASLVSIYIGYKVFGLLGLLYGPIAYVIIQNMVRELTITSCQKD